MTSIHSSFVAILTRYIQRIDNLDYVPNAYDSNIFDERDLDFFCEHAYILSQDDELQPQAAAAIRLLFANLSSNELLKLISNAAYRTGKLDQHLIETCQVVEPD